MQVMRKINLIFVAKFEPKIGSRSNLENPPKTRLDLSRIFGGGGLVGGGSINSASQLIFSLNLNSDEFVKFESLADFSGGEPSNAKVCDA